MVAENFQRQWLLFELNTSYCEIAKRRIESGDNIGKTKPVEGELSIETFLKDIEPERAQG